MTLIFLLVVLINWQQDKYQKSPIAIRAFEPEEILTSRGLDELMESKIIKIKEQKLKAINSHNLKVVKELNHQEWALEKLKAKNHVLRYSFDISEANRKVRIKELITEQDITKKIDLAIGDVDSLPRWDREQKRYFRKIFKGDKELLTKFKRLTNNSRLTLLEIRSLNTAIRAALHRRLQILEGAIEAFGALIMKSGLRSSRITADALRMSIIETDALILAREYPEFIELRNAIETLIVRSQALQAPKLLPEFKKLGTEMGTLISRAIEGDVKAIELLLKEEAFISKISKELLDDLNISKKELRNIRIDGKIGGGAWIKNLNKIKSILGLAVIIIGTHVIGEELLTEPSTKLPGIRPKKPKSLDDY